MITNKFWYIVADSNCPLVSSNVCCNCSNNYFNVQNKIKYTRIVTIIAPPPPTLRQKKVLVFTRGGGNYWEFSWIFTFFDSRHFQMSSSELKLYFITYYRPLVYFEVFSIYLSIFHEFMWSPKKAKTNFFEIFWIFEFFFSLFSRRGGNYWGRGGQLLGQFGYLFFYIRKLIF